MALAESDSFRAIFAIDGGAVGAQDEDMPARVVLLLTEGFTDSGLSVMVDVLRAANSIAGNAFEIVLASAKGGPVLSASGLVTASTRSVRAVTNADVVLVLGLWVESSHALDAALERPQVRVLVRAVTKAVERGALVGASCAGVFLLAEAGVLANRRATTTWWLASHLQTRHPSVRVDAEAALVTDRKLLTSGAVFGVADLALHLVARSLGPRVAHRCANLLLLDRHPSQAPYMAVHQLSTDDPLVRSAEKWARAHLPERFSIARLAKGVGTSQRTLTRKLAAAVGQSPLAFVQRIRVETAVFLLRTSSRSLDQISDDVGYEDASTLRRLLRREARASPRELRLRRA